MVFLVICYYIISICNCCYYRSKYFCRQYTVYRFCPLTWYTILNSVLLLLLLLLLLLDYHLFVFFNYLGFIIFFNLFYNIFVLIIFLFFVLFLFSENTFVLCNLYAVHGFLYSIFSIKITYTLFQTKLIKQINKY